MSAQRTNRPGAVILIADERTIAYLPGPIGPTVPAPYRLQTSGFNHRDGSVVLVFGDLFDLTAIGNILLWFSVTIPLMLLLIVARFWGTRFIDEMTEIFEKGNVAVSLAYGGQLIGLGLIVNSSIQHNDTILQLIVTAVLGFVLQTVAYLLVDKLFVWKYDFNKVLVEGNVAAGAFIGIGMAVIGHVIAGVLV